MSLKRNLLQFLLIASMSDFFCFAHAEEAKPPAETANPENQEKQESASARVLRATQEPRISFLSVPEEPLPIVMVQHGEDLRPMVKVPLKLSRPGWTLKVQGQSIPAGTKPGTFMLYAYLLSKVSDIAVTAEGPDGEILTERLYVASREAQEFSVIQPWDAVKVSVGSTYLLYHQTGFVDFYSWSGLAAVQFQSPEEGHHFGYAADADITALTYISNKNYGPQLAHANVDGAYFFNSDSVARWHIQALAGVSYLTMFSNGAPFGFRDLMAVEVGLRGRIVTGPKTDYLFEARYTPLSTDINFAECGLQANISRGWILKNTHRAEVGFRYIDYQYKATDTKEVGVRAMTLSFGYGL